MSCKKDCKTCDGDSLVCRLNPSVVEPYYYDQMSGERRKFYNRECSFFKKVR